MKNQSFAIRFIILLLITFATACELIVIGTPPVEQKPIYYTRESALGTVVLFIAEMDTNNIQAAAQIIDTSLPPRLNALDRYDMYYDLIGTKNYINDRDITGYVLDTLDENKIDVIVELNYTKKLFASTKKTDSIWFITDYKLQ